MNGLIKVESMSGKVHLMDKDEVSKTFSGTMCGRGITVKGAWVDPSYGPPITCKHCKRLEATRLAFKEDSK